MERRWLWDDVVWTWTLCEQRCGRVAAGLLDGIPVCLDCADLLIERAAAVAATPILRELLPPLFPHLDEGRR